MKRILAAPAALVALGLMACVGVMLAQQQHHEPPSGLITKSGQAIGYEVGGGDTKVDLRSTGVMPGANGEAKVQAKAGATKIEAEVKDLAQPSTLGAEFLTYVLWSVSPEGRTSNLGEIIINNSGQGKITVTTQLQTFSLIVTAEPYFSVRQPSEVVILENEIRKDTKGKRFVVSEYRLMKRNQYAKLGNPLALSPDLKKVPLEMYQARNALDIARSRKADSYAPEIFTKADASLKMAENALARKADRKQIVSTARQAVQFSEDARALAVQRQEEERIASEREAAAQKAKAEAEAKAAAEAAAAKQKADAEAAELKRKAAEEAKLQAELAAAREARLKAESELAAARAAEKAKAEADALRAKEDAAKAEAERARLAAEQASMAAEQARKAAEALRTQLLEQFNRILDTRDTERGLVVNLADVLFDTGKYELRPVTREKLARFSGIVLGHPSLNLEIEGHTDSTGSDELNQTLSEQRAESVRGYLIEQGLPADHLTAKGFGKTMPVADNSTSAGRQQNRRVEIVVSGEVIGTRIGN